MPSFLWNRSHGGPLRDPQRAQKFWRFIAIPQWKSIELVSDVVSGLGEVSGCHTQMPNIQNEYKETSTGLKNFQEMSRTRARVHRRSPIGTRMAYLSLITNYKST